MFMSHSHHLGLLLTLIKLIPDAVSDVVKVYTVLSSLILGLVNRLIRATDYPCPAYLRHHQKGSGHPKPALALLSKCWLGRIISIETLLVVRHLTEIKFCGCPYHYLIAEWTVPHNSTTRKRGKPSQKNSLLTLLITGWGEDGGFCGLNLE